MLHINLKELLQQAEPVTLSETLDIEEHLKEYTDISSSEPLRIHLRMDGETDKVRVQGTMTLTAQFVCGRCLTPVKKTLTFPFHEIFSLKEIDEASEEAHEIHVISQSVLHLMPYLIESLQVQLPLVIVCDESCKGLCPQCGINLNNESCSCIVDHVDPRLAVLREFFDRDEEKPGQTNQD